jgi:hypothetical protein
MVVVDRLGPIESLPFGMRMISVVLHAVDDPRISYNVHFEGSGNESPETIRKACFRSQEEQEARAAEERSVMEKEEKDRREFLQRQVRAAQVEPRAGKPTYAETAHWLMDNLPKIAPSPRVISMDKCLIIIDRPNRNLIPLSDMLIVTDEPGTSFFSGHDTFITFKTKHSDDYNIGHAQDYDSQLLVQRVVKALNHAVSLCSKPIPKTTGPF